LTGRADAKTLALLRQRTRQLRQEIASREAAERHKDEVIATLSHELRTPLTALQGFSELLLHREFDEPRRREILELLHREAARLGGLLTQVLDLQRLDAGHGTGAAEVLDLGPLVAHQAAVHASQERVIEVRGADVPALILADPGDVERIVANLLSNATKYSDARSEITVTLDSGGGDGLQRRARLAVRDRGIGIRAEELPRLFDAFYRVDTRETRTVGGTGLGLAIVKRLVVAQGGRVWAESEWGVGTTFFVEWAAAAPRE